MSQFLFLLGTYSPLVGAFSGQRPGLLDLRASPAMPGQLGHARPARPCQASPAMPGHPWPCTLDIVRWTSYVGHRTLDIVRWTSYVGHRTLDIVRWTLYGGHRTLDMWLHILLLRWMAPFETKIKTDIPRFQHVDFWCFGMILADFWSMLAKCSEQSRAKHVPNVPNVPNFPNTNIVPGQHS